MKTIIKLFAFWAILFSAGHAPAQTLNWNTFTADQKHLVSVHAGAEYGLTFGAGYGFHVPCKLPLVLNAEYSFPSGQNLFDDFKTKAGIQIQLYQWKNFRFSAEVQGVFRRYETEYTRMLNFGSDMSATIGYYTSHWFVAGEFGFDKAIVTHFMNSEILVDSYPGIQNGWYQPSTGGNFYYGVKGGYSFTRTDAYLKMGKVIAQNFETSPMIPMYFEVGMTWKFQ